eukprot:sb/3462010/
MMIFPLMMKSKTLTFLSLSQTVKSLQVCSLKHILEQQKPVIQLICHTNSGYQIAIHTFKGRVVQIVGESGKVTVCRGNWEEQDDCSSCDIGWDIETDCSTCAAHYYPAGNCLTECNDKPNLGKCDDQGTLVCESHVIPENTCDRCETGWNIGTNCTSCADNYYPAGDCSVPCTPNPGMSSCTDQGKLVCGPHVTGNTCDTCENGWDIGDNCSSCSKDFYPAGNCSVNCIYVPNMSTCDSQGNLICEDHVTGDNCDSCEKEWDIGTNCTSCAENYYPAGVCDTHCVPTPGMSTCDGQGQLVCEPHVKPPNTCDRCETGWDIKTNCTTCDDHYYPARNCSVKCIETPGMSTCTNQGQLVCNDHVTGNKCDTCENGWDLGTQCSFCSPDFYPAGNCSVNCVSVPNMSTCDDQGTLVCKPHVTGDNCDKCLTGWDIGTNCTTCDTNYYPAGDCSVLCIPTPGMSTCDDQGKLVCGPHVTGDTCDTCENGWDIKSHCETCAPNFYPAGNCSVRCTATIGRSKCDKNGILVCDTPFSGPKCDKCAIHYYGTSCTTFCRDSERFTCDGNGRKECATNWFGNHCDRKCVPDHDFLCTKEGERVCMEGSSAEECKKNAVPVAGIGGGVGGGLFLVLFLVLALVALFVLRKRRREANKGSSLGEIQMDVVVNHPTPRTILPHNDCDTYNKLGEIKPVLKADPDAYNTLNEVRTDPAAYNTLNEVRPTLTDPETYNKLGDFQNPPVEDEGSYAKLNHHRSIKRRLAKKAHPDPPVYSTVCKNQGIESEEPLYADNDVNITEEPLYADNEIVIECVDPLYADNDIITAPDEATGEDETQYACVEFFGKKQDRRDSFVEENAEATIYSNFN